MSVTELETIEIETGADPFAAVIWMHGLGANGEDFLPIVRELDLHGCLPIRFVFPHAPVIPVTVNNGYMMRAWYDIFDSDIIKREDEAGLRASQAAVERLIAAQNALGIPSEHIVVAGFSQGCAMALQVGLRHPKKLGGVLCLSGYVPLSATLAAESNLENRKMPIFMAHGRTDPVIPLQRAIDSRNVLNDLGYEVEWHEYPMPHSLCPQEIDDIGTWLRSVLI